LKQIKTHQLAFTFAGCFLGAGFVSGQELWQFFGTFGNSGLVGLVVSLVILGIFGILLLLLARMTGIEDMGQIIAGPLPSVWPKIFAGLQVVFLFGIVAIMVAGMGALVNQLLGIPAWIVSLAVSILTAVLTLSGIQGIVAVFSAFVPIIVVATLGFSVAALCTWGVDGLQLTVSAEKNPMLPNWWLAAITYANYNMFCSIGIMTPLGKAVRGSGQIWRSIALGVSVLLCVAAGLVLALSLRPEFVSAALPMLALATQLSPGLSYVYGLLLMLGMLGTSLASFVAIFAYFASHFRWVVTHQKLYVTIAAVLGFSASLAGFGDLISTVYPVFGYLSMAAMILMVVHYIRARKDRRKNNRISI